MSIPAYVVTTASACDREPGGGPEQGRHQAPLVPGARAVGLGSAELQVRRLHLGLPEGKHSNLVRHQLLLFNKDVRYRRCYCLQYETLRRKSCVSSPPQSHLNELAVDEITKLLANPNPNLNRADQDEYKRWQLLHTYLKSYEADSGEYKSDVVLTRRFCVLNSLAARPLVHALPVRLSLIHI